MNPCKRCGKTNPADIHTCTPIEAALLEAIKEVEQLLESRGETLTSKPTKLLYAGDLGMTPEEFQAKAKKLIDGGGIEMNREDVIRLAREAAEATGVLIPSEWNDPLLERFAVLVKEHLIEQGYRQCAVGQRTTQFCGIVEAAREEEREACAKVCAEKARTVTNESKAKTAINHCVAAIRARGQK